MKKKTSTKKHDYDHKELIFTTYLEVCSTELKTDSIHSVTILLYMRYWNPKQQSPNEV